VTRAAASCVGIDFLEEGITFLRSKGYDVVQADAEDFELGRSFDVIVAGEVLEHLSNPRGFLLSARRHLRSEGRLVITTPNPWFFAYSWLALFGEPPENTEHTAWYTLGTLRELLRRAGFEIERAEYGSGQDRPYRLPFAPDRVRHNSLWVAARLSPTGPDDHPRPPGS
jgi:SAM-dependent methyltransferase